MSNEQKNYAEEIASMSDPQELATAAEAVAWDVTIGLGIECNCGAGDQVTRGVVGCEGSCTNSLIIALRDALKRLGAAGGDTTTDEQDSS